MNYFFRYIILWNFLFLNISSYSQVFSEVQKVVANVRQLAGLGYVVSISGEYAAISAFVQNRKNSVYIYQKNNLGQWVQIQKIESPENTSINAFACSVDIHGDYIVIGDISYRINSPLSVPGAAYVYKRDINNQWNLQNRLLASDQTSNDNFGFSVSISGNKIIVGARQHNGLRGAAYIFEEDSFGSWIQKAKLVSSDNQSLDVFGCSVAMYGNTAVIGANYQDHDETGNNYINKSGSVYIFEYINGSWIETQKIVAPDRSALGYFGYSVFLDKDRLIIGGGRDFLFLDVYELACAAYIYERNPAGIWVFVQKLSPPDPANPYGFGHSVGLSGDYATVAAYEERFDKNGNSIGTFSGAVYVYKRQTNGVWDRIQKILSSDLAAGDYFGWSVAIEGNTIIVGAPGEDEDGNGQITIDRSGSAYVFETCPPSLDTISHTTCERYTWQGQTYMSSGSYNYQTIASSGCDSIVTLQLTILPISTSESVIETCTSYSWNGTTYTQSGTYTYQTISTNGCDSIATLDLTIHESSESAIVMASCDTYDWNGQTYTQSGMYSFQTQNVHGCDSVATLLLTIFPSYLDTSFITTCDAYFWSGSTYNQSGTYTWSGQTTSGCDSILTLVLNIQITIETEENITACDSYIWNGNIYTSSGLYTHQTISSLGCDSIVTLYLEVFPTVVVEENLTACDTLVWNGQTYDESGLDTHQSQTFHGCDSITQLFLTILPSSVTNLSVETCETYTWNGQTYQSSGIYTYQSTNHLGCDSTVVLDLTIYQNNSSSTEISACDVYEWNGSFYAQSGIYTFETQNINGCDSSALLNLIIHPSYDVSLTLSDCVSVDYSGTSYTESGLYTVNLQSQFGCDSIIWLDVRILSERYEEVQTSCDSFYWPVGDQYFDQSGVYQQTFTNIEGCDSTFLLKLEIHPSYKETENITTCDNYLWNVNQNNYAESGLYEFRSQTIKGCDSLRFLQLNIKKSFEQRDTVTTTSTYQWPVNNQEYDQSGNYELRFTSVNGCDSLYFLVLRINQDFEVLFPNIISSQGASGKFKGYSTHPQILLKKLSVFDRMASRVYHIENVHIQDENYGWDGKFGGALVLPGVYAWIAELLMPAGTVKVMTGDVTVVR
jgi:hypothetical protein